MGPGFNPINNIIFLPNFLFSENYHRFFILRFKKIFSMNNFQKSASSTKKMSSFFMCLQKNLSFQNFLTFIEKFSELKIFLIGLHTDNNSLIPQVFKATDLRNNLIITYTFPSFNLVVVLFKYLANNISLLPFFCLFV